MAKFKKGDKKPENSGRKKGVGNKTDNGIKEAFKNLVEGNLENITAWMEEVAAEDPAKALEFMHKFAQFNVPTLARSHVDVTTDGKPLRDWKVTAKTKKQSKK